MISGSHDPCRSWYCCSRSLLPGFMDHLFFYSIFGELDSNRLGFAFGSVGLSLPVLCVLFQVCYALCEKIHFHSIKCLKFYKKLVMLFPSASSGNTINLNVMTLLSTLRKHSCLKYLKGIIRILRDSLCRLMRGPEAPPPGIFKCYIHNICLWICLWITMLDK